MSGVFEGELIYNLADMINELGRSVTVRNLTVLGGAQPYPNPPTIVGLTVSGAYSIGATSVNLSGSRVNGRVLAGDILHFAPDATVYTVGAPVSSNANAFAGLTFSPALVAPLSNGAAVAFAWSADTTIQALVTNFPNYMLNDTTIQRGDKRVRFLASAVSYVPTTTDKLTIGADVFSIVQVRPMELQGTVYAYACQARR